tara:strand:+ start:962 stop:1525 length:564 start_codon:yes stop_codon:yes gene_type:complete
MLQKRGSIKRRKFNNIGLIVSSCYLLLSLILKGISYTKFESALHNQQIAYTALETKPSPFNTILWTANVETEDAFLIGDYSFFDTQPIQFFHHPKNHAALGDLKEYYKVQRLIKITQGWYTISEREASIYLNDLRFGLISLDANADKFAFSFLIEKSGNDVIITEEPKNTEDAKKLMPALWQRIKGN